ncbi:MULTISPECIES: AraC family transcriptional regulator [Micrococcales]
MSGQATERCEYTVYPGVSPSREIVAAISLLNATLDRGWQIADLASAAALSSSQLTRLFRTQIGVSAAALLRQLRAGSRNHKT